MALERARYNVGGTTVVVVALPDRRASNARPETWTFAAVIERVLFGGGDRSSGAMYRLLERCSLTRATLLCGKKAVTDKLITQAELDELLGLLREGLPSEHRGRVRCASLLPVAHIKTLCQSLGRSPTTVKLLEAMSTPLPQLWTLQMEQESNTAQGEVDYVLDEDLAELEEADADFAAELSAAYVPFVDEDEDEEETVAESSWKLPRVPEALTKELDQFKLHRTDPLVRAREGTACVDITVGNDRASVLRFLGWLKVVKDISPGLGVFCRAALGEWVEEWLRALREKGCRFSTLANYANSIAMCGSFVYSTYKLDDDVLAMPVSPLSEVLRLRSQAEGQAKHDGLYTKRHADWISWQEAHEARIHAEKAYRALPATVTHTKRVRALREWLAIACYTLMPPCASP